LALLRPGLGQLNKRGIIIATDNAKAFGSIASVAGLVAAIVAPVISPLIAVARAIALTAARLLLARLLFGGLFAHRFGQKPGVMLGMLQEVFGCDPVIRKLRVTGQKLILLDDLLGRATHLAFGTRAVEHPVDNIAEGTRAVLLGTRAGLGRAHLDLWDGDPAPVAHRGASEMAGWLALSTKAALVAKRCAVIGIITCARSGKRILWFV
jgi:hypothetical protein